MGKVTVYVWKSSPLIEITKYYAFDSKDPNTRIGHASMLIEFDESEQPKPKGIWENLFPPRKKPIYVSFWPVDKNNKAMNKASLLKSGVNGSLMLNLKADINGENANPDITITLNKLNVLKMEEAFLGFANSDLKWSIWGSSFFNNTKSRNCSGLVKHLLEIGGAKKIDTLPELFRQEEKKITAEQKITLFATVFFGFCFYAHWLTGIGDKKTLDNSFIVHSGVLLTLIIIAVVSGYLHRNNYIGTQRYNSLIKSLSSLYSATNDARGLGEKDENSKNAEETLRSISSTSNEFYESLAVTPNDIAIYAAHLNALEKEKSDASNTSISNLKT